MPKTYVITDVHGRLNELQALLSQVPDGARLVFLGDYVDRGSDSRGVVELVRSLPNAVRLRGNHEDMLCAPDPHNWLANGGASTVLSYKHPLTGDMDWDALEDDKAWFRSLPRVHSDAHRVYVHAGVNPAYSLAEQPESVTQWFRYPEGADIGWRDKHVVHGHTPGIVQLPSRTCLDAGMRQLCCGIFDDDVAGGPVELLWA
jgi:serine/threonine protein phosphatase 1